MNAQIGKRSAVLFARHVLCPFSTFIPVLFGKQVIPGGKKVGKKSTFLGNWNSPKFMDSTCFFARFDDANHHLAVVKSIQLAFIWNALIR